MGGTSKENIIKEIRCKGTYSNVCVTQHYFILPFFLEFTDPMTRRKSKQSVKWEFGLKPG